MQKPQPSTRVREGTATSTLGPLAGHRKRPEKNHRTSGDARPSRSQSRELLLGTFPSASADPWGTGRRLGGLLPFPGAALMAGFPAQSP